MSHPIHTGNEINEITEYLLGGLPEERMEQIEERMFTDVDFHLEVEAGEADLLDSYVYGELNARSRRLFEENFLNTEYGQRRLQFALALKEKLAVRPAPAPWFAWSYALAASLLLAAGLGARDVYLTVRLAREEARVATLDRQGGAQRGWSPQDAVLVASLKASGTRGVEQPEITVPNGIRAVQLVLQAPDVSPGRNIVRLLDDGGRIVAGVEGIESQVIGVNRALVATFPIQYFSTANYFIEVSGQAPGSKRTLYPLKVVRE